LAPMTTWIASPWQVSTTSPASESRPDSAGAACLSLPCLAESTGSTWPLSTVIST
jgi:hypothetical protein